MFIDFQGVITSDKKIRNKAKRNTFIRNTAKLHNTKIMAQGSRKLAKPKKSSGAHRRKTAVKKKLGKGPKQFASKGAKRNKQQEETTKAINRKNEALVSAKALNSGSSFFLSDIKEVGKKELNKQVKERNKKQLNAQKLTNRIQDKLKKLEEGGKA